MTKFLTALLVTISVLSYNTSFSQDTTINDALDFIKTNLNMTNKFSNPDGFHSFEESYNDEESYLMNYSYEGNYTYTVISTAKCMITFLETLSGKTRISYSEDEESPDETPIYSVFGYVRHDTIKINFADIARVESDKTSITLVTYNNRELINHHGTITTTPPKKREDDLVRFFKDDDEILYKKTRKFLKKNNLNYNVYPEKVERFEHSTSRFTISNLDREKCKRLVSAFSFLQKNCGAPKEKF